MSRQLLEQSDDHKMAEKYSSSCDNIHAPQELRRKVMDMTEEKIRAIRIRRLVAAAAFLVAVVIGSNAITYAATGTGWIGRLMVSMDSSEENEMVFEELVDSYGRTYYFGYYQPEVGGKSFCISTYDPTVLEGKSFRVEGDKIIVTDAEGNEHIVNGMESEEEGYHAGLAIPTYYPED